MLFAKIDDLKKKLTELLFNLRNSEAAFLLFFSTGIGLAAGISAVFFYGLIDKFNFLFFVRAKDTLDFLGPYYVIVIPALGGLISGPIIAHAKETKGHGVPEVMLAIAVEGGKIRPRVAAVKAIASSICIGSGGSVGREGPIIQIGSAIGSTVGQLFKLSEDKVKILVACGAAGGVAATFNAPLAGIFFALEVILGEYGPRFFSSVVLASVTATVVSRHYLGDHPAFTTPLYTMNSAWEIPHYFIFGLVAAAVGVYFKKILYGFEDAFDDWKFPEWLKPMVGGLLLGVVGFYFPQVFGSGNKQMELALHGHMALWLVAALVLFKTIATSITLGSGGSGGVFAPALFVGAMLGSAYGQMTQVLTPFMAIPPGACALVGMGAVFAGASYAPISAILIIFEMTGDYKIMLPLMITCIISAMVARRFSPESIYTLKLMRRGIDIRKRRGVDLMASIKVSEAMIKNVISLDEDTLASQVRKTIQSTHHRGYPVISNSGKLVGVITLKDINRTAEKTLADPPIRDIMSKEIVVCYPNETLRTAFERLGEKNIGRIPVVETTQPDKLLGFITRKGVIKAYNKALKDLAKLRAPQASGGAAPSPGGAPVKV